MFGLVLFFNDLVPAGSVVQKFSWDHRICFLLVYLMVSMQVKCDIFVLYSEIVTCGFILCLKGGLECSMRCVQLLFDKVS